MRNMCNRKGLFMNNHDDFFSSLCLTIAFVLFVVANVVVKAKGLVEMPLWLYIVLAVVLLLVNSITYLPLFSGYFVVLKLLGRLAVGWGWIVAIIVLDILYDTKVSDMRGNN